LVLSVPDILMRCLTLSTVVGRRENRDLGISRFMIGLFNRK